MDVLFVEELLFAGGLGGRFNMPLGISLDVPLVVVDVFKLLEGDDVLFALPLLLLLLNVDKLCLTGIAGELFVLKLFAFDSILKLKIKLNYIHLFVIYIG